MKTNFEIIDVWAVHGDSGTERHNNGPVIGYCSTEKDADAHAVGKGWWGGVGKVTKVSAIVINGETYVLANPHPVTFVEGAAEALAEKHSRADAKLRESTLASLSDEQRRVLGLKPAKHAGR